MLAVCFVYSRLRVRTWIYFYHSLGLPIVDVEAKLGQKLRQSVGIRDPRSDAVAFYTSRGEVLQPGSLER